MKDIYLCLDVGGTQIKAAAVDRDGGLLGEMRYFPARAKENREVLLGHFASIVETIQIPGAQIRGVHLAFPGPFDYGKGICLLQGLDKYDQLYGINLRQCLAGRLSVAPEKIRFINDAAAYALGEMGFGHAKEAARLLCICIGTGCGSAFGVEGKLAPPGTPGVPRDGYVYNTPFLGGCVDDFISRRGLLAVTKDHLGMALDGKKLSDLVRKGDTRARQCFLAFGCQVRDALLPFLEKFKPEVLCFGGQITRSASLFLPPVEEYCRGANIQMYVTEDTSIRTMQGLTRI